ncbi:hypothetical protein [Cohnella abietis]|uniref:Uncharacterized protein n=1 Tax=Cohnella abietis TaxID=2507935 RepID=A0A3T1D8J6_9BACL|nr:hypothetical protein [Cohnella abietis]BBI34410.1 hypothetical protein KCTCHS21_38090 [Cohnella abietis]
MNSPWITIVLIGIAITGYAFLMPKTSNKEKEQQSDFSSEAAYNQLLEDLEDENRELLDAVAKFKKEQDDTVEKLGRRIIDMEQQMKNWSGPSNPAIVPDSNPSTTEKHSTSPFNELFVAPNDIEHKMSNSDAYPSATAEEMTATEEIMSPPTTIRGRYRELLEMHDKGSSIDKIAKAMGMNKGEVQLIVQLVRREEQQHA